MEFRTLDLLLLSLGQLLLHHAGQSHEKCLSFLCHFKKRKILLALKILIIVITIESVTSIYLVHQKLVIATAHALKPYYFGVDVNSVLCLFRMLIACGTSTTMPVFISLTILTNEWQMKTKMIISGILTVRGLIHRK